MVYLAYTIVWLRVEPYQPAVALRAFADRDIRAVEVLDRLEALVVVGTLDQSHLVIGAIGFIGARVSQKLIREDLEPVIGERLQHTDCLIAVERLILLWRVRDECVVIVEHAPFCADRVQHQVASTHTILKFFLLWCFQPLSINQEVDNLTIIGAVIQCAAQLAGSFSAGDPREEQLDIDKAVA